MSEKGLQEKIESYWKKKDSLNFTDSELRSDVNKVLNLLDSGEIRVSEKKNTYLKFFRISHHVLMGIPSGSLLLAGGYVHYRRRSAIWLLENGIWNPIGNLQNVNFKNEKNISLELRLMLMDLQ